MQAMWWVTGVTVAVSLGCGGGVVGDDPSGGSDDDGLPDDREDRPDGGARAQCGEISPGVLALGGSNGSVHEFAPSITVGADRHPILAYRQEGSEVALHWDGAAWQPLGQEISAVAGSYSQWPPSVTARGDRIVMAWVELTSPTDPRPYAAEWNGESWAPIGGAIGSDAYEVEVALDMSGAPIVVWSGYERPADGGYVGGNMSLHAARWDGSSWQLFGSVQDTNPDDGAALIGPSLAIGGDGSIYLAWSERTGGSPSARHIQVRRRSESDWVPVGSGVVDGVADGTAPSVVVDSGGRLVVGWSDLAGEARGVYVSRWDGSTWERLGSGLSAVAGDTDALLGAIAVDSFDRPVVGWVETARATSLGQMHVYRHDGTAFVSISGSGLGEGVTADDPALTVDECDRVFAAWSGYDGVLSRVFASRLFAP